MNLFHCADAGSLGWYSNPLKLVKKLSSGSTVEADSGISFSEFTGISKALVSNVLLLLVAAFTGAAERSAFIQADFPAPLDVFSGRICLADLSTVCLLPDVRFFAAFKETFDSDFEDEDELTFFHFEVPSFGESRVLNVLTRSLLREYKTDECLEVSRYVLLLKTRSPRIDG